MSDQLREMAHDRKRLALQRRALDPEHKAETERLRKQKQVEHRRLEVCALPASCCPPTLLPPRTAEK